MTGSQEIFTFILGINLILLVISTTIYFQKKYNTLTIFQVASLFYCFVYAVVPIYFLISMDKSPSHLAISQGSNDQFKAIILAIFGYFILIIGYYFGGKIRFKKKITLYKELPLKKYEYWAFFTFFLGMFGVVIEIQLQGGIINSLNNIELIRGFKENNIKDGINNPLVFFRMFKPFLYFSFYVFYLLFRHTKHFRYRIMVLLTFILSAYILFIGGGRTHIIIFLATILVGFIFAKRKIKLIKTSRFRNVFSMVIMITIAIISLIILDPIFAYLTYGRPMDFTDTSSIDAIMSQFSFPFTNIVFVMTNEFSYRFFQDLFLWLISLFPAFITSRIGIPETIPLYEYNTILQFNTMLGGGVPNDILTLGFYQLGLVGTIVILLLFAIIISRVDKLIIELRDDICLKPIILRVVIYLGMIVMYADLEGTFRSRFDVILLLLLLFDYRMYKQKSI